MTGSQSKSLLKFIQKIGKKRIKKERKREPFVLAVVTAGSPIAEAGQGNRKRNRVIVVVGVGSVAVVTVVVVRADKREGIGNRVKLGIIRPAIAIRAIGVKVAVRVIGRLNKGGQAKQGKSNQKCIPIQKITPITYSLSIVNIIRLWKYLKVSGFLKTLKVCF